MSLAYLSRSANVKGHYLMSEYISVLESCHINVLDILHARYRYINSAPSDAIYFFLGLHPLRHAATLIFSGEPVALYRHRKKHGRKKVTRLNYSVVFPHGNP